MTIFSTYKATFKMDFINYVDFLCIGYFNGKVRYLNVETLSELTTIVLSSVLIDNTIKIDYD